MGDFSLNPSQRKVESTKKIHTQEFQNSCKIKLLKLHNIKNFIFLIRKKETNIS